jgi:hypothetical protein
VTATLLLAVAVAVTATPTPEPPRGPTFCVEWIRQSSEGYDRLTLFRNRMLVWKTHRGDKEQVKREELAAAEAQFYCDFFAREDMWKLPADLRTGLTAELAGESAVTLARPDGLRRVIRFDDLSTGDWASSALRSALDGLKGIFLSPLAAPSRFAPNLLPPGTLLRRFDGHVFRVSRLEKATGYVELEGVNEPYSQWVKIEELRFQFGAPEPPP